MLVFLTQPKLVGPSRNDNSRNIRNKRDDEVRLWLSMGRPKVIIMVPIWKCVGLSPIWFNFPDVLTRVRHETVLILIIVRTSDFVRFTPIWSGLVIRATRS